jgi:hypothetical protein
MYKALLKTILIFALSASHFLFAQEETSRPLGDNILWARYWLRIDLSERIRLHEMFINQTFLNGGFRERQILNHLFTRYTGKNKEFYGVGFSYSNRWQDENIEDRLVVPEYRIFEEIGKGGNLLESIRSNSSVRLEQRFFHNASEDELLPGHFFKGRIRYTQIFSRDFGEKVTGRIDGTIFFDIWEKGEKPGFNSIRTSVGLEHHISDRFSINADYQLQMKKPDGFEKLTFGHVIRLSFIQNIQLKKDGQ